MLPDQKVLNSQDKMIDEMLDSLKESAKIKLRKAYESGAISEETQKRYIIEGSHLLPKIILNILFAENPYAPLLSETKKEIKNLQKYI